MLGLFGRSDAVSLTLSMTEQMSYVTIALRVLILVNNVEVNLDVNGNTKSESFNKLS